MTTLPDLFSQPFFADGSTLEPQDHSRLAAQMARVRDFMAGGAWHTLAEIEAATGFPQASISARLRDLRKARFGSHTVERRRRGPGTFEYALLLRQAPTEETEPQPDQP